ncbi:hypothetical protein A2U01_0093716, partial [Trifolium medium]|nr:hypothetical protein [Trifolium medium]
MVQKKSFYDSTDFFLEPKHNDSIYGGGTGGGSGTGEMKKEKKKKN